MATQGQDFFRALAVALLLAVFAMGVLLGATRFAVANQDEPQDVQIASCYVERGSEQVCS